LAKWKAGPMRPERPRRARPRQEAPLKFAIWYFTVSIWYPCQFGTPPTCVFVCVCVCLCVCACVVRDLHQGGPMAGVNLVPTPPSGAGLPAAGGGAPSGPEGQARARKHLYCEIRWTNPMGTPLPIWYTPTNLVLPYQFGTTPLPIWYLPLPN